MKKVVLALSGALMFLSFTIQAQEIQDTMSFGLKVGGSAFLPTVDSAQVGTGKKDYKGRTNIYPSGSLFFDYMFLDDWSLTTEVAYSRKGYCMVASTDDNKRTGVHIHALDITFPAVSFFPMGEDEGLAITFGHKAYVALLEEPVMDKGANQPKTNSNTAAEKVMTPFNMGLTAGLEYEFAETGLLVGVNYDFFVFDTFNNNTAGNNQKVLLGKNKDDKFYTQGAQLSVGFDFARLLD